MRDALHVDVPAFTEARIDSADLTELKPAEYHADLVVLLLDGVPVYGIVVEAQLSRDPRKRFVWPVYATSLRARLEVPVSLLVVTTHESIARWAAQPIDLGSGSFFRALVVGPSGVPEIVDAAQARADPELAVLSALAHGRDADVSKAVRIALAAEVAGEGLDERRWAMYFDLVLASLSEAARKELRAMNPAKYEYQSEFARHYFGQGLAEGRAALLERQLTRRFGSLSAETIERLRAATIEELDAIGERLLSAESLAEAVGVRSSKA
jgi:hypothetical protein